jgi:hypothetical protein
MHNIPALLTRSQVRRVARPDVTERIAHCIVMAGRHYATGGVEPAFEQREDHRRVADEDCDEGFADGPLAGHGGLGGTDLDVLAMTPVRREVKKGVERGADVL